MELICSKKLTINEAMDYQCGELNLDYYLIACELNNSHSYGIHIKMTDKRGVCESAVINDVFTTKASVLEIINIMHKNSVTPTSAHEVIYDCIA